MTLSKPLNDLGLHIYTREMGRILAAPYVLGRTIYEDTLMNEIPQGK